MQNPITGPVVLGASGKVGRALRQVYQKGHLPEFADAIWQYRSMAEVPKGAALVWDILQGALPTIRPRAVIVLAGVTAGRADDLARNTTLALAACALADQAGGVPVLLTSSQAVYGAQSGLLREQDMCLPSTPYGRAKREMERAVAGRPNVTCLRIGNVVGCDAISGAMVHGGVTLDRFPDGQGPRRAMIGPVTLGHVLQGLLEAPGPLPPVLNVAAAGAVAMADLLAAAGVPWGWQDALPHALPALDLDVSLLQKMMPVPGANPVDLIAQARLAGWSPAL